MSDNSTDIGTEGEEEEIVWTDDMIYWYFRNWKAELALTDPSWYACLALFGIAMIPLLFVCAATVYKLSKARTRFTWMMFAHNIFALWYSIYGLYSIICVLYVASAPRVFPSAIAQLLNQLMFFSRLGLFRVLLTWYTERVELIAKCVTGVFWLATFWLSLLWVFVDTNVIDLGPPAEGSDYTQPVLIGMTVQIAWVFYVMVTEIAGTFFMVRGILELKATSHELFNSKEVAASTNGSVTKVLATSDIGYDQIVKSATKSGSAATWGANSVTSGKNQKIKADPKMVRKLRNCIFASMFAMIFFDIMIVVWNLLAVTFNKDLNLGYLNAMGGAFVIFHYVASAINMHLITMLWGV